MACQPEPKGEIIILTLATQLWTRGYNRVKAYKGIPWGLLKVTR